MEPMSTGRRNHVNVAMGHCLYVLGGLNNEVSERKNLRQKCGIDRKYDLRTLFKSLTHSQPK